MAQLSPKVKVEGATAADADEVGGAEEEEVEEEEDAPAPKKKSKGGGRKREQDPLPLKELPTPELVARLRADGYRPPALPVPVLGYCCLNMTLRDRKPPIFTSRDCIKRTLESKGLPHLGELCLANCRDLALIIQWCSGTRSTTFACELGEAAQRRQLAQLQEALAKGGASRLEHYVHNVVGALNLAPAMFGQRETYLDAVRRRQDREALAQLRTGSHWGAEETGRWTRRPREQRVCPHCHDGIEDAPHMLLTCPLYAPLRLNFPDLFAEPHPPHRFLRQKPMGTFEPEALPQFADICAALSLAGDLARLHNQRLTFHPSHFVKLASPDDELVTKSIKELEAHSRSGYSHEIKFFCHSIVFWEEFKDFFTERCAAAGSRSERSRLKGELGKAGIDFSKFLALAIDLWKAEGVISQLQADVMIKLATGTAFDTDGKPGCLCPLACLASRLSIACPHGSAICLQ
ncbi:hypothetical protein CHLNCDRAFT_54215 [Chlorella variabilis]|uniref:Uncharacterized protein n=1 Tax=Chlorella variabilis TaxID=554065 RepID=E1ZN12_CHLVA|nr:hypothetical protein CHLNCDRAFT_54215 [Chlorella variabilis]EFN52894.1 hypothetical protein CHLNCDRAFT_54215 [Chlorella variabilis]|eukprot:XP_005844996.1 hypothetical protein CHLNCDRAFT_54215 [Chlorella variabilis]